MKYGDKPVYERGKKVGAVVKCQGCGEEIRARDSDEDVDYCVTKRGTVNFWHSSCFNNVWNHKIV